MRSFRFHFSFSMVLGLRMYPRAVATPLSTLIHLPLLQTLFHFLCVFLYLIYFLTAGCHGKYRQRLISSSSKPTSVFVSDHFFSSACG
ncbi:unnamed protein product [Larinioides sclopetarius]|uniref:Uncharacterized protein n=1 Tax=Larinioides sclopetarius TaxID=280406 RepID=A0AAV1YUN6_9ARAC